MADAEGAITELDRERILASSRDYIESWLDGDAARMARCLHPALSKRSVDPDGQGCKVDELTRDQMIELTGQGIGKKYERPYEVSILDAFDGIASVRLLSWPYMDYLHLARCGDAWLIFNAIWQRRPGR